MVTWKDVWVEIRWQWLIRARPYTNKFWILVTVIYNKFKRE